MVRTRGRTYIQILNVPKKYIHEPCPNNHGRASIRRVPFLYKAIPPETSLVDVRRAGADQSGVQSGVLHAA
jgi:hypothetical protein